MFTHIISKTPSTSYELYVHTIPPSKVSEVIIFRVFLGEFLLSLSYNQWELFPQERMLMPACLEYGVLVKITLHQVLGDGFH